jgi:peptidoglycan-associated lipoprotein
MKTNRLMLTAMAVIAVAGCASKRDRLPPEPGGNGSGVNGPGGPGGAGYAPGSQGDFVANTVSDRIYFETDRFNVDAGDVEALRSQAAWLQRYPNARVVVEGHCDERGTRDYNLALGERRANSAKNYLASLGVNPARISTISYGKERPDAQGSDADSWARNRRAVTVTVRP